MKTLAEMPGDSRVWLYTIERALTEQEKNYIIREAKLFMDQWTSHGSALDAAAEILYDRFLVIAADESKARASGCGIDKSVHFVQRLQQELQLDFFSRTIIYYKMNDAIQSAPIHQFWAMRKAEIVTPTTVIFDSTVQTISELKNKFETTFEESWHQQLWER